LNILSVSHFFFHSQMNGKIVDNKIATLTMMMLVLPNWEIPKKVATVFGKEVIVVMIVR